MSRLILFLAAGLVGYILWHYLRAKVKKEGPQAYWKAALVAIAAVLILLAATGRAHYLLAIGGAILALAGRMLPLAMRHGPLMRQLYLWFRQWRDGKAGPSGRQSQVRTQWLHMTLAHDSGAMDGEILDGALRGRQLSSLSQGEFQQLCEECRQRDGESLRLLSAWVSRTHPEWAGGSLGGDESDAGGASSQGFRDGTMSVDEAREILGVEVGATRDEIVAAHRKLMGKLHPDKGGSTYLASKINQAKDRLMRETV